MKCKNCKVNIKKITFYRHNRNPYIKVEGVWRKTCPKPESEKEAEGK